MDTGFLVAVIIFQWILILGILAALVTIDLRLMRLKKIEDLLKLLTSPKQTEGSNNERK